MKRKPKTRTVRGWVIVYPGGDLASNAFPSGRMKCIRGWLLGCPSNWETAKAMGYRCVRATLVWELPK